MNEWGEHFLNREGEDYGMIIGVFSQTHILINQILPMN